jgi:hypothetical protein
VKIQAPKMRSQVLKTMSWNFPGPKVEIPSPENHVPYARVLAAWFPNPTVRAESRFPNPTVRAESRFPNPTVRAGSTGGLKRGTVTSDGRTHARTKWIYI